MGRMILALLAAVFVLILIGIHIYRETIRLGQVAGERSDDSICRFARALDYRRLDTKVIRAVYEGLQESLSFAVPAFPVRMSDDVYLLYRIDPEEIEDIVCEVADRCGRSLDGYKRNPHYSNMATVGGIIEFLCAQPRISVHPHKG